MSYIEHVLPALSAATQQRLVVSQAGVVDAHVHPLKQGLNGGEHGEDLLLVAQVTFIGDQGTTVARTLTFSRQLLQRETERAICNNVICNNNLNLMKAHFDASVILN